jgi:pyruvate dehydrogenase E2 component (dihydrolipoamide acetyltransferase)
MIMEFKLPEIGEGVQEGELIKWLVKEGDQVQVDQALLEVMTDKATVEVPATDAGKVTSIKAKEGDMIKVGQVLATIEAGASVSATEPGKNENNQAQMETKKEEAPAKESKGFGIFAEEKKPSPASTPSPTHSQPQPAGPYQSAIESLSTQSIPAAPIVRAMAREAGVDLSKVTGSGPLVGGVARVLEKDLLNYLNEKPSAPSDYVPAQKQNSNMSTASKEEKQTSSPSKTLSPAQTNKEELVERKPLRGLRRLIAQGMVKSKFTAPHYSYVDEFECSDLIKLREQAKAVAEEYGIKFSYLPFIIKAVVGALKDFPIVNSSLEDVENGQELVMKKFYHIGFAVATDEGLIVPVIKHADQKSLLQIAKELVDLSNKVRAGKASADELKGSTFTITSLGNVGGLFAMPIINYPEAGILGVYKIQEKPIVQNGQIVVGKTMALSLSLDHRIVDGAVGAQFCNSIIDRLKNPAKLLLENF